MPSFASALRSCSCAAIRGWSRPGRRPGCRCPRRSPCVSLPCSPLPPRATSRSRSWRVTAKMLGWRLVLGGLGVAAKIWGWNRFLLYMGAAFGDRLEQALRQTLSLAQGDPALLLQPINGTLLVAAIVILASAVLLSLRRAA